MKRSSVVLLMLVAGITSSLFAQNSSSNKGTEFWVGFMAHSSSSAGMYLYITSDSSTSGTVSIPGQNWSKSFTVTANNMTLVQVPTNLAYVDCSDCIRDQGIKVVSDKKIIVYSHIYYQYRSDATLVLPTNTTGKQYYCMAYKQGISSDRSQFMIVGQKDSTYVRITPTVDLKDKNNGRLTKGKSYYIWLDEGEVYQGRAYSGNSSDDISGTYIEVIDTGARANCRTVSVFSGNSWTSLGCSGGFNSGDNLYEQMYPVNSWGSQFVTVPLKGVNSDNLRFLAAKDQTTIIVSDGVNTPKFYSLNAGEYEDLVNVDQAKFILASGPIMVAQYSKTQSCSGGQSDPSMTIINPVEQTLKNITLYSSRYEAIKTHYINVVIPAKAASSFRIDGKSVTFSAVKPNTQYSYAQISVNEGNHVLSADEGFVATAYGFGQYESYGYAAGANVRDLTAKIELANSSLKTEQNICLGQEAQFKGTAEYTVARWEWYFGDGAKDTVQNASHEYLDTGLYEVKLYTFKKTFDGCSSYDSAFMSVRVTGRPEAKFSSRNRCEKNNVFFTDESVAPYNDRINYRAWKFHIGGEVFSSNTSRYYDTTGTYPVRFVVKTPYGCYDTLIDSVHISPLPVAEFKADKACQLDSNKFTNLSTVRTGSIVKNEWLFGDGDTSYRTNPNHFYQDSGYFNVTLTVTTDSGCTATYDDDVYKYANVNLDFTFNDTCKDIKIDFTNTSNTGGAPITGMGWRVSDGDSSDKYNFSKIFTSDGTYNVILWTEIDSFCFDQLEKEVDIYPVVVPSFSYSTICENETVEFINRSVIKSGSSSIVSWDMDDGNTSTSDTNQVDYKTPGTKYISLKLVSDKGCYVQLDSEIMIRNVELTNLNFMDTCQGTEQTFSTVQSLSNDTIDKWEWKVNGVLRSTGILLSTSFPSMGKYEIKVDVETIGGCKASIMDSIFIHPLPTADFTVGPVCDLSDFAITNNSTAISPYTIDAYDWFYRGSQVSSSDKPVFPSNRIGNQTIRLVVTSNVGCMDTLDIVPTVYALPNVQFRVQDTCLGQTTSLIDNSSVVGGTIGQSIWKFHDGTLASGTTTTKKFDSPFSFLVNHVIISNQGCADSLTKSVSINPLPVIDISAEDYDGCIPFTPVFVNNSSVSTGNISQYLWTMGNGTTLTTAIPSITYDQPGSYPVKVIVTTDKGCVDSATMAQQIVAYGLPTADFSFTPEKPSILESTVTFTDLSSSDVSKWFWDLGDGSSSDQQNPIYQYNDTGLFQITLTVTNDNGCTNSTMQEFFLSPDLFVYIPTSFSPNGDLINDKFGVSGVVNGIKNYQVNIYNRWGERIFHSENADEPWDGTYQGQPVPPGSYVYEMRFTDYLESRWYFKNGEVLLIK